MAAAAVILRPNASSYPHSDVREAPPAAHHEFIRLPRVLRHQQIIVIGFEASVPASRPVYGGTAAAITCAEGLAVHRGL